MDCEISKKRKVIKIAVFNNKGGVGKTTFAINFARLISKKGAKVLFIDNDGQANSSMILTKMTEDEIASNVKYSIFDMMTHEDIKTKSCIINSKYEDIDIICATDDHNDTPDAISSYIDNTRILKEKLTEVENDYDYIIIDCAPTRDRNVYNALFAVDLVLTPVEIQMFSQVGLRNLLGQIAKINKKRETPLLLYVFLSKVDNRQKSNNEKARNYLQYLLAEDFIKADISLLSVYVKSFEEGTTAIDYRDNRGFIEMTNITSKILEKINEELI